ncbi:MAG: ArdC family protein [Hyphomicrobiaceae bacterium]
MSQKMEVHQATTERIIEPIGAEAFKLPWHRPSAALERPVNIQSSKSYRGVNMLTHWIEAPVRSTNKQFSKKG